MSKLTKNEVANYIRNKGTQNVSAGSVIEYDSSLVPTTPKVLEQQENLKALIELYKSIEECEE